MNDSINKIKIFFEYYNFIEKIKNQFPNANWQDCLSKGQIDSKLWLIDELIKLDKDLGNIFIYGGWYGTLARFMFESNLNLNVIRSFDIDEKCHVIAETINRSYTMDGWKFKATTYDIFDIDYPHEYSTLRRDGSTVDLKENPDTIINTSSEHMEDDWYYKIPDGTLVIIQSNDFFEIDDHINCITNLDHMKWKYPMSNILFIGKKELQKFNRYMLIGEKSCIN